MSSQITVQGLRAQNQAIKAKIKQFQEQRMNSSNLKGQIEKFVKQSQKNINDMTQSVSEETDQQNAQIHGLTTEYEGLLKQQIQLLTANKQLSEKKETQDNLFNQVVENLTAEYEGKIKEFETKVKTNVKRIQEMSGSNIIKKLLKNDRFKEEMKTRGVNIENLQKQSSLEDISNEVEEVEQDINKTEAKSQTLDEELTKMRELIDTMKQLLENMVKEKENVVKQNVILKEKLKESEEIIQKLLGADALNPDENGN